MYALAIILYLHFFLSMATEATVKKHIVSVTTITAVTGKTIIHSLIGLVFSCLFSGE